MIGRISSNIDKKKYDAFIAVVDPYDRFDVRDTMYMENYFNNHSNLFNNFDTANVAGTHVIDYKNDPMREYKVLGWIEKITKMIELVNLEKLYNDTKRIQELIDNKIDQNHNDNNVLLGQKLEFGETPEKVYLVDSLGNKIEAKSNRQLLAKWVIELAKDPEKKNIFYKMLEGKYYFFKKQQYSKKTNRSISVQIDDDLHVKTHLDTKAIMRRLGVISKECNVAINELHLR